MQCVEVMVNNVKMHLESIKYAMHKIISFSISSFIFSLLLSPHLSFSLSLLFYCKWICIIIHFCWTHLPGNHVDLNTIITPINVYYLCMVLRYLHRTNESNRKYVPARNREHKKKLNVWSSRSISSDPKYNTNDRKPLHIEHTMCMYNICAWKIPTQDNNNKTWQYNLIKDTWSESGRYEVERLKQMEEQRIHKMIWTQTHIQFAKNTQKNIF